MVKNILLPTDGSDYGKTAIAYGIAMARKLGARLIGLHVIDIHLIRAPAYTDLSGAIGLPPFQEFLPAIENGLDAKADAILRDFRESCQAAGAPAETRKITGVIDETIVAACQRDCDWVLLAQWGEHFHIDRGALLGSTTQSVVRHAGMPVCVTPAQFHPIERMAAAYDGSAPAGKALQLAAELSQKTGWPLAVVIVASDPAVGERHSRQARELLSPFTIDTSTCLLQGKEDRALLGFARGGTADLLVMGAYGHNRLRELLVGSTTSAVIRKSAIPVLCVR